jgi:hypothetical protein
MGTAEINGVKYPIYVSWEDLTLSKFKQVIDVPMPDRLRKRWQAILKKDDPLYNQIIAETTFKEIVKQFPKYYGEILGLCSEIPPEVIDRIDWRVREQLFNEYLLKFCITGLSDLPLDQDKDGLFPLTPKINDSFEYKGERYFLPRQLDRGGTFVPLVDEPILTFSEAADIEIALHDWAEKGIDAIAQIAAVYLRKEGEVHSDELVIERTELFKELPMDKIWIVFFCVVMLGVQSQIVTQTFLRIQAGTKLEQPHENPGS